MKKLLFGTAGIPSSTQGDTVEGVKQVRKLGLDAMELEFVRNVNLSEEKALEVKRAAEENRVVLTCHGQYFINLNAVDKKKLEASKKRVLAAARRSFQAGAWSVCFHPAYLLGMPEKKVYENVKSAVKELVGQLKDEGVTIWVRPETAGKLSQFGSVDELISMSEELEQVMPCIDFSHVCARSNGKENEFDAFALILSKVEKRLGKDALNNLHIHAQGIEFNEKGERKHMMLNESGFNYNDLLKALKEFNAKGVVICESPVLEEDALILAREYAKIG